MIKIIGIGQGGWMPVFICDQCGAQIKEEGNLEFEVNNIDSSLTTGIAYQVHKRCDDTFTRAHPVDGWWVWEDLSAFLRLLAENTNVKPGNVKTWGEILGWTPEKG